jgi:hypothetical protein
MPSLPTIPAVVVRSFPIAVGVLSAVTGLILIAAVVHLASDTERSRVVSRSFASPRPVFALDTPDVTGAGRFAERQSDDPIVRNAANIAAITAEAADWFEVPLPLLDYLVGQAVRRDAKGYGWLLDPVDREILVLIQNPEASEMAAVFDTLVAFLGEDPRPLDSHLSRRPEVGIGVRAAHLAASWSEIDGFLRESGFHPHTDAVWFVAMVAVSRGTEEVVACIEEARRIGPDRSRKAFVAVAPTYESLSDRRFILRSFLNRWAANDARERRERFLDAVADLAVVFGLQPQLGEFDPKEPRMPMAKRDVAG